MAGKIEITIGYGNSKKLKLSLGEAKELHSKLSDIFMAELDTHTITTPPNPWYPSIPWITYDVDSGGNVVEADDPAKSLYITSP